jgi:hypothetical protein
VFKRNRSEIKLLLAHAHAVAEDVNSGGAVEGRGRDELLEELLTDKRELGSESARGAVGGVEGDVDGRIEVGGVQS